MERPRATLSGARQEPACGLLREVLRERGFVVEEPDDPAARLALVLVAHDDAEAALVDARAASPQAVLVAVLPFRDERLARRSLAAGARAWWALGDPLADLGQAIVTAECAR